IHFFWGGFDLAATRFSGRPAPPHPGGIPHVSDRVMREAYSHEVSSAGFWTAVVRPDGASYHPALGEFVLPYAALRTAANPSAQVLAFLQSTYAAAAD